MPSYLVLSAASVASFFLVPGVSSEWSVLSSTSSSYTLTVYFLMVGSLVVLATFSASSLSGDKSTIVHVLTSSVFLAIVPITCA